MGYYVRLLANKKSFPNWKLQFITQKKEFAKESKAKIPRKEWDIPKNRWISLGFGPQMNHDQARIRATQLNAQLELKRQEERRQRIEAQIELLQLKTVAVMPEIFKEEFETKYIYSRFTDPRWQRRFLTDWRAAQRMLLEVTLDPLEWHDESHRFYDYFRQNKFSLSYIKKIILVTNLWGHFLSRKLGQPFLRIPLPRGKEKAQLLDAYFEKQGKSHNQSDPITVEQLEAAKESLRVPHYNWLFLSVWLGLRPQEVDQLKKGDHVRLERDQNNILTLWVFQTKLTSVPRRYRWKLIPIIFPEQHDAIAILRSGDFKRPLVKTIRNQFGQFTTLYGGRKGFTDLMLGKNQDLVHVSQWMGHSSIDRTWRTYKSRRIAHHSRPSDPGKPV